MLHRSLRCVTQPRDFRGVYGARRRPPRGHKVPLNFNGLAPTIRDGAEPAELPKEQTKVAGEDAIVSGMAGRYATALFELAREQNAIDTVKVESRPVRRAGGGDRRSGAAAAQSGVLRRRAGARALRRCSTRWASTGSPPISSSWSRSNRRLFAVLDMAKAYRALVAKHKGEVTAEVTVAEKPSEAHLAAIKDALSGGDQEGRAGGREGRSRRSSAASWSSSAPAWSTVRCAPSSMRSSSR